MSRERQAMLSVYFFSEHDDATFLPDGFQPMPLQEAVSIIRDAASLPGATPVQRSRQLRAITKLFAAGRTASFRGDALGILGPSLVDHLENRLQAAAADGELFEPRSHSFESWISNELRRFALDPCERTYPLVSVTRDTRTNEATGRFSLSVRQPPDPVTGKLDDRIRRLLDPQRWDECGSPFWEAAHVARSTNGVYLPDANHNVPETTNPPQPGSTWNDVLFEHFQIDLGFLQIADFKILLNIETLAQDVTHTVKFDLQAHVHSTILGSSKGGVGRDVGHVIARQQSDWVEVTGVKTVKVGGWGWLDPTLNLFLGYGLQMLGDDLYDMVCCS